MAGAWWAALHASRKHGQSSASDFEFAYVGWSQAELARKGVWGHVPPNVGGQSRSLPEAIGQQWRPMGSTWRHCHVCECLALGECRESWWGREKRWRWGHALCQLQGPRALWEPVWRGLGSCACSCMRRSCSLRPATWTCTSAWPLPCLLSNLQSLQVSASRPSQQGIRYYAVTLMNTGKPAHDLMACCAAPHRFFNDLDSIR